MKLKKISDRTVSEIKHFNICLPSDYIKTFSKYVKEEGASFNSLLKEEIKKDYEKSKRIIGSSEEILSDTNKLVEKLEKNIPKENRSEIEFLKKEMIALKEKVEALNFEVHYDELIGCLNRKWIYNIFLNNGNFNSSGSVVFIDLNDFKDINDIYGHHVGDLTLKYFADFIISRIDQEDKLIRYAGDEFILFSKDLNIEKKIEQILNELKTVKLSIKNKKKVKFSISFAYGVFIFEKGMSFKEVFEQADKKMYDNKKEMKNGGRKRI